MENTTITLSTPKQAPDKINYTRQEAAAALGVSAMTIDAFMRRRDHPLPHFRVGTRKILVPRVELERWCIEEAARQTGR